MIDLQIIPDGEPEADERDERNRCIAWEQTYIVHAPVLGEQALSVTVWIGRDDLDRLETQRERREFISRVVRRYAETQLHDKAR